MDTNSEKLTFAEEFKLFGFFYIMQAIYWMSIGFMAAYWILYYYQLNLRLAAISSILLVSSIASLIFEIPTGIVADIFGRKISVFVSYLIAGLCFVGIILVGANLISILIFSFFLGVAQTFQTGALESWFIDTIKYKGKSKFTHKLLGRQGSIGSAGFVIGPFLGGVLANYGLTKAFWATALSMLFLAIYVLFGKEEYFKQQKVRIIESFRGAVETGKRGLNLTIKHSTMLILTVISFFLTLAFALAYSSYQLHVTNLGLQQQYLGYALSIAGLISIFVLNYSDKISKFFGGRKNSLMIFTILAGIAIFLIGTMWIPLILFMAIIAWAVIYELMSPDSAPAFRDLFNSFVPGKIRATVGSIQFFVMTIGGMVGLILFGLIGELWGLKTGLVSASSIVLVTSLLYFGIKKLER